MKINQATSTATLRSARAFISSDMISAISLNKCVSLSLLLIQHVWAVGLQSHWLMTCMERCSSTWDARAFNANSGVPAPENSVQSCTWTGFFWASQQSVKKTLAICSGQWNNCFNGVSVIVMSSGLTSSSVSFFSLRCFFGMRTDATLAVVFFVALGALDLLPFSVVFASFFCFLFDVVLSTPTCSFFLLVFGFPGRGTDRCLPCWRRLPRWRWRHWWWGSSWCCASFWHLANGKLVVVTEIHGRFLWALEVPCEEWWCRWHFWRCSIKRHHLCFHQIKPIWRWVLEAKHGWQKET